MQIEALGLLIVLVPTEVEPLQAFENRIDGSVGIAFDVGVVEAENHGAAVVAGVEPVENKRARAAHVQKTGGRRRETHAGAGRNG